jgi:hypothetical protein
VSRYGAKLPLIIGPLIAAAGFVLFAIPGVGSGAGSYWITYFPAVVVLGLGMAVSVAPLTTAVLGAVGWERAGIASGVNNAVARLAGLLAIAVLGIVMVSVFSGSLQGHLAVLNVSPGVRQQIDAQRTKLAGIEIPTGVSSDQAASIESAIDDSFVTGFRVVMLTAAGLAVMSALSAALLIEGKKGSSTGQVQGAVYTQAVEGRK